MRDDPALAVTECGNPDRQPVLCLNPKFPQALAADSPFVAAGGLLTDKLIRRAARRSH